MAQVSFFSGGSNDQNVEGRFLVVGGDPRSLTKGLSQAGSLFNTIPINGFSTCVGGLDWCVRRLGRTCVGASHEMMAFCLLR